MKKLFLSFLLSLYLPLSAQSIESLNSVALENGTTILEIEKSILEKSYAVKSELSKLKDYSQSYDEGTLVCSLSRQDYVKYQENLNILTNIYTNMLPSLIFDSKEYLQVYLGLSNEEISELNSLHLNANRIPSFPPVHFNGQNAPANSNLQEIVPNIYEISPTYRVTYSDVVPIYLPNIDNQILPVLALGIIELRMNYPDRFFLEEYPNLNTPIPGYTYETNNITWQEVLYCAAVAIGADFLWGVSGLSGNQGEKWTRKAIIKAFGKIATRMLGPVGTLIAVGTFGVCLYEQDQN